MRERLYLDVLSTQADGGRMMACRLGVGGGNTGSGDVAFGHGSLGSSGLIASCECPGEITRPAGGAF